MPNIATRLRGVPRESEDRRAGGQNGESDCGEPSRQRIEQFFGQHEDQNQRCQVDHEETQVDACDGLAKTRHRSGIGKIGARQLDVVDHLVGRNALEDQPGRVGEFPLVTLQGDLQ